MKNRKKEMRWREREKEVENHRKEVESKIEGRGGEGGKGNG